MSLTSAASVPASPRIIATRERPFGAATYSSGGALTRSSAKPRACERLPSPGTVLLEQVGRRHRFLFAHELDGFLQNLGFLRLATEHALELANLRLELPQ